MSMGSESVLLDNQAGIQWLQGPIVIVVHGVNKPGDLLPCGSNTLALEC